MSTPVHIALLCSRLDLPGGIERAVINTANLFSSKGHPVTLVVLDETADFFFPLDPKVKLVQQPLSFGITQEGNPITRKIKLLTDVLKLRKLLRRIIPGIVIASEYPFAAAAILCGARKRCPVVSWEHHHYYELKRNAFWERVFELTYPRLNAVVCLNEDEKKLFGDINSNCVVVPNFITPTNERATEEEKTILTVARSAEVKGIDLLLQLAPEVLKKNPGWVWKLIGTGEMDPLIKQTIREQGLTGRLIHQLPEEHDITGEYADASLYVMTSRNECFPMTLLEAMNVGLPCVAFDCETGPRHIISNEKNGLLVEKENMPEMVNAITSLLTQKDKRKKMSDEAIRTTAEFSPEAIYKRWHDLFRSLNL